jgi:hypothetical protein
MSELLNGIGYFLLLSANSVAGLFLFVLFGIIIFFIREKIPLIKKLTPWMDE